MNITGKSGNEVVNVVRETNADLYLNIDSLKFENDRSKNYNFSWRWCTFSNIPFNEAINPTTFLDKSPPPGVDGVAMGSPFGRTLANSFLY